VRRLGVGESPIRDAEWIDRATAMGEFLMLGLRLNEGVALDEFARRFGQPFVAVFGPTAAQLRGWGLLEPEPTSGRLRLTDRGQLVGNEVFARFLPD
jgi:oxygen-independent coproporphyrinogen-3 oxidase